MKRVYPAFTYMLILVILMTMAYIPQVMSVEPFYIYGTMPYIRPGLVVIYGGYAQSGNGTMQVSSVYHVVGTNRKGVEYTVKTYSYTTDNNTMKLQDYDTGSPWREGMFYMDPTVLRHLKTGDRVVYGQNEYIVAYVGSLDGITAVDPNIDLQHSICHPIIEALKPTVVYLTTARQNEDGSRDFDSVIFDRDRGIMIARNAASTLHGDSTTSSYILQAINYDFHAGILTWDGSAAWLPGGTVSYAGTVSMELAQFAIYAMHGCIYRGKVDANIGVIYTYPGQYPVSFIYNVRGILGGDIRITPLYQSSGDLQPEDTTGYPILWVDPGVLGTDITIEGSRYTPSPGADGITYNYSGGEESMFSTLVYDNKTGFLIGGVGDMGWGPFQLTHTDTVWMEAVREAYTRVPHEDVIVLQIGNPIITVNGKESAMDTKPTINPQWGRTVVPVRFVAQALGAKVGWNGKERKVTIEDEGTTIYLWIGKPQAQVNGKTVWIDEKNHKVTPIIIDNRTMVPLRFVAESLGLTVGWNPIYREIYLVRR